MRPVNLSLAIGCFALFALGVSGLSRSPRTSPIPPAPAARDSGKFVYADFETLNNGRPVSSRGGLVKLMSYQESPSNQCTFKGMGGDYKDAPESVRLSKDSPNKAIAFDYHLVGPNQFGGVGVQIHGLPDKDGKPAPEDLSAYKNLSIQVFETGVPSLRVEFVSNGNGIITSAYPQTTVKISPGFNTYEIRLKSLLQPPWKDNMVDTKDVLKKLTSINITAACGPCTQVSGKIVVDNLVFEN